MSTSQGSQGDEENPFSVSTATHLGPEKTEKIPPLPGNSRRVRIGWGLVLTGLCVTGLAVLLTMLAFLPRQQTELVWSLIGFAGLTGVVLVMSGVIALLIKTETTPITFWSSVGASAASFGIGLVLTVVALAGAGILFFVTCLFSI